MSTIMQYTAKYGAVAPTGTQNVTADLLRDPSSGLNMYGTTLPSLCPPPSTKTDKSIPSGVIVLSLAHQSNGRPEVFCNIGCVPITIPRGLGNIHDVEREFFKNSVIEGWALQPAMEQPGALVANMPCYVGGTFSVKNTNPTQTIRKGQRVYARPIRELVKAYADNAPIPIDAVKSTNKRFSMELFSFDGEREDATDFIGMLDLVTILKNVKYRTSLSRFMTKMNGIVNGVDAMTEAEINAETERTNNALYEIVFSNNPESILTPDIAVDLYPTSSALNTQTMSNSVGTALSTSLAGEDLLIAADTSRPSNQLNCTF